jgi:DNA-binding FrmR family transcriptional regulator
MDLVRFNPRVAPELLRSCPWGGREYPDGVSCPGMSDTPVRGYSADKDQLGRRLARIEGQVRGVQRMVDEDRYCIDVLQQISAIQAALNKVALGLVDGHVRHCIADAGDEDSREEMTTELRGAVGRLVS